MENVSCKIRTDIIISLDDQNLIILYTFCLLLVRCILYTQFVHIHSIYLLMMSVSSNKRLTKEKILRKVTFELFNATR